MGMDYANVNSIMLQWSPLLAGRNVGASSTSVLTSGSPAAGHKDARETEQAYHMEDYVRIDDNFLWSTTSYYGTWALHTVLLGRWRDTSEHITLKEGRALVLAFEMVSKKSEQPQQETFDPSGQHGFSYDLMQR